MIRIEMMGTNGAGKSTLLRAMMAHRIHREDSPSWHTEKELRRLLVERYWAHKPGLLAKAKGMLCHVPKVGKLWTDSWAVRLGRQAYLECRGEEAEFFHHCMRLVSEGSLGSKGHVELNWLFQAIKELCWMRNWDGAVVIEESLSHELAGLLASAGLVTRAREAFYAMPRPDAVIHVGVSEEVAWSRLVDRERQEGRSLIRHRGLGLKARREFVHHSLAAEEMGASMLAWRGVPVLHVDGEVACHKVVDEVERFLDDITSSCRTLGANTALVDGTGRRV